jgi:hypothetical protein
MSEADTGVKPEATACDSVGVDRGFEGPENTSRGPVGGWENGFKGPFGPSEKVNATLVDGVGSVW